MEEEATERLPILVDRLGLEEFVLWGHSDGATVALCYAGVHTDPRLRGVVSVAAHVFGGEPEGLASIRRAVDEYEKGDLRRRLARHHDDPDGAFRGWADTWLHPDFVGWSVESYLNGIRVPVLVIQSRDDEYGTLAQVEAIRSRVPHARVVLLDGCGHQPQRTAPERLIAETVAFLEGS
jgi:pimeloyl-ACP methyl ester carboxylesterase